MAGTLIINANADWLPAGWIFDSVVDSIVVKVSETWPDLARSFREARTEGGSGYLDMAEWPSQQVVAVLEAVQRHRRETTSAGARAFHDPVFFPAYVAHLDDLITKMLHDPRAASGGNQRSVMPPQ